MKEAKKTFVLWFTGLSGSGKSTICELVSKYLSEQNIKHENLDGDIVREAFPSTGFAKEERIAHNKRITWLAEILERNGICTLVSFITPYQESRDLSRVKCKNYIEIYVATSLEECESRDVKGLYKRVRDGEIKNFTGIDDPFEEPENPELKIFTKDRRPEDCAEEVIEYIKKYI
jgi:adenylylsulfate kinase